MKLMKYVLLLLLVTALTDKAESAVTYQVSPARFGDRLTAYCKARYIAYKYRIPLLYVPFEYSNQLALDDREERYTKERALTFKQQVYISTKMPLIDPTSDTLYIITTNHWNLFDSPAYYGLPEDIGFFEHLKQYVKPKKPLTSPACIHGAINVAAHVRTRGYFDRGYQVKDDGKFPPQAFYIRSIRYLMNYFKDKPLHIHIFTDDPNPKAIAQNFTHAINSDRVSYSYRTEKNNYDINIVEDFFALTRFDALIRGRSCYSGIAQLISDNEIVIYTQDGINDDVVINKKFK
jgi:hypothetical protein